MLATTAYQKGLDFVGTIGQLRTLIPELQNWKYAVKVMAGHHEFDKLKRLDSLNYGQPSPILRTLHNSARPSKKGTAS